MIVVVGRPGVSRSPGDGADPPILLGPAAGIAVAAAAAGASVELVGSVGDDDAGDAVAVALGQAGVRHSALMRVPGAVTPRGDQLDMVLPRLDARDLDLALRYVRDCAVLVLAELLPHDAETVALEAASYHGARVVAVVGARDLVSAPLARAATVLDVPGDRVEKFAALVGCSAAALDAGTDPERAFPAEVRARVREDGLR